MARRWWMVACALLLAGCSEGATSGGGGDDALDAEGSGGSVSDAGDGGVSIDAVGGGNVGGDKDAIGSDGTTGPAVPSDFGGPCNDNSDCSSGFCVEGPQGFVCTKTCLADCPDGFSCKAIQNTLPDVVFLCIPLGVRQCIACQEDFQCPGGECRLIGDGSYCVAPCGDSGGCSTGYQCSTGAGKGGGDVCLPLNASCSCSEATVGLQRSCSVDGALGTCWGVETCDAASGWQGCTAASPSEEVCDGLDNDCDGLIDEGLPQSQPCESEVPNVGTCAGTATCAGPLGWVCDAGAPASEACDHLDNDCDGQVDEDYMTGGAYTAFDHCGACNISCSQGFSHATAVCDASGDVPHCIVESCDPGFSKLDDTQCIPADAGLCEPCASDEQCLLAGSKCVDIGDGSYCGTPCEDSNDCPTGFACGEVEGGALQCTPTSGSCTCSADTPGLSKSCSVTSSPPGAPVTICYGIQLCDPVSGFGPCDLPAEVCDQLDNDCDGTIDEGFRNAVTGKYDTPESCGQCGNNCTFLSFANGQATCDASLPVPACAMTCTGGFFDVNANPSDGCECAFQSSVDVPDTGGLDANCDGVDGEIGNAVFVAKNGSDANPGTPEHPKQTVQAAIDAAKAGGKRDVYVATGVYTGSVSLVEGVGVYGGYRSDFRQRAIVLYETVIIGGVPTAGQPGAVNAASIVGPEAAILDGFTIFGWNVKGAGQSSYAVHVKDSTAALTISNCIVVAGRGGNGVRGDEGSSGGDGASGGAGKAAKEVGKTPCSGVNAGGAAGSKTCGGVNVSGGKGGDATCPDYDTSGTQPKSNPYPQSFNGGEHGSNGKGPGAGQGGTGGYDALFWSKESGCGICRTPKAADGELFQQGPGNYGTNGADGSDGGAGAGCGGGGGTVAGGLWNPLDGGDAGSGVAGGGGGGGGAGGGVENWDCPVYDYSDFGGGGGGGGSGGCPGTGGQGGTGGGGSFAFFLVWAVPPASAPVLYANAIETGDGGIGGDGGNGGTGGTGGDGLPGGAPGDETPNAWCAEQGGNGGRGGNGGHGGGGGGGCGGASFGVFAAGQGGLDLSGFKSTNTFALSGSAGAGGIGGASLGKDGKDGLTGPSGPANF